MRRASAGILWSAVEAGAAGLFSLGSALFIARVIGPSELGIGAAAASTYILFRVGVNSFFADAMVQRADLGEEAAASAFWASIAVGFLAGVLQAALGFALVPAIGDVRLLPMALLLGAALPLVGAGGAVQGRVTRERRYHLLAGRTLIGQGIGTITGIGFAFAGGGAWAVVAQQAVTSVIGTVVLLASAGWRPAPCWNWRSVRELIAIGVPLTASTLVLHGRYRVFAILIGSTAGATALGEVHLAFRLVDTVRELASTALWRLMLPAMSEHQRDRPALRACAERWLASSGLVLFPLCAALLVSIGPLTQLLLGPLWASVSSVSVPLIVVAAWSFLIFPAGVALVALGIPSVALRAHLASSAVLFSCQLALRPATAQHAVWLWVVSQFIVAAFVLPSSAIALQANIWRTLRAGVPCLGVSVMAAAAAVLIQRKLLGSGDPFALLASRLGILVVMLVGAGLLSDNLFPRHRAEPVIRPGRAVP